MFTARSPKEIATPRGEFHAKSAAFLEGARQDQ
jgi:hypothetical protein